MPYKGLTAEDIETTNLGKTVIIKNWHPYSSQKNKRTLPISMIFMVSEPLGNTIVGYSLDEYGTITLQLEFSPTEGDRLYVAMAEYLFKDDCERCAYVFQGGVWQEFVVYENMPSDMAKTLDKLDDVICGESDI